MKGVVLEESEVTGFLVPGTDLVEHCDLCLNLTFLPPCLKYWPHMGLPGPDKLPHR